MPVALSSADEGVDAAALLPRPTGCVGAGEGEGGGEEEGERASGDVRASDRGVLEGALSAPFFFSEEGGRRGRRRSSRRLLRTPLQAALVDDSGSGMLGLLVLLVTIPLALCSLFVFTPEMLGILVGMDQKGHSCRDTQIALLRTWKPGPSMSHWYLAPTCSVRVTLEEHREIWSFLGDDGCGFLQLCI